MRRLTFIFLGLLCTGQLLHQQATSQVTERRWSLSLQGGGNLGINDFNQQKVGAGAEVGLRYGLSRFFSLGFTAGYEELKSGNTIILPSFPFNYMKVTTIPAALVGYVHFLPKRVFNPYVFFGAGAMWYKRSGPNGLKFDDKGHLSYVVPVGAGFEAFTSRSVSINVDFGYTNIGDWVDTKKNSSLDGYLAAKAGIRFYFGSSDEDDDDNDGLTNAQERRLGTDPHNPDTDNDGLKDGEEVRRYRTNPLKADTDGDGLLDGEEVHTYHTDPTKFDTDGDGLSDGDEVLKYHTDPLRVDTDGDGLSDGDEVLKYHTDPLRVDTDGDGLSDYDEVMVYHTDPLKADTDGDGLSDGDEVKKYHTDPLKADTDGGGVNDGEEVRRGTNPLDPRDDNAKETIILEKGKTVILGGVNFSSGSARLTKDSEKTLQSALQALIANATATVEIAGYTDNVGSPQTNERLSLQRAESIKSWLVQKGIAAKRMTTVGKGVRDPIASNTTTAGRAKNRRIEFHVR